MINFFINAIAGSFNLYWKNFWLVIIASVLITMISTRKNKYKRFIFTNLFILYLMNVFVISLWKVPQQFNCLGTSIYYRPLFSKMHWIPGNFISDFYHTYLNTHDIWYSSKFLWFTILNIIYFIPMGIFLKISITKNKILIIVIGLLISLMIEYLQTSGIHHLYNCSWRFFDIDDIITNVLGTYIGFKIILIGEKKWRKK